jgi:hypothetical protein
LSSSCGSRQFPHGAASRTIGMTRASAESCSGHCNEIHETALETRYRSLCNNPESVRANPICSFEIRAITQRKVTATGSSAVLTHECAGRRKVLVAGRRRDVGFIVMPRRSMMVDAVGWNAQPKVYDSGMQVCDEGPSSDQTGADGRVTRDGSRFVYGHRCGHHARASTGSIAPGYRSPGGGGVVAGTP